MAKKKATKKKKAIRKARKKKLKPLVREMPGITDAEVYYVGIRYPTEIRRNLLEASREMVSYLQRYEKFKLVREEKAEMLAHLREDIKSLKAAIGQLKSALPKAKLRYKEKDHTPPFEAKPKKHKKKKAKKTQKIEVSPKKELSELEKLEQELGKIENKLGTL